MSSTGSGLRFHPPPTYIAEAVLAQAAAVQNTWYTVLDTTQNVRLLSLYVLMGTANENLETRLTIDGQILTGAQTPATAGTPYYVFVDHGGLNQSANVRQPGMYYSALDVKSAKYEMRKVTANGANVLTGRALYQKW